MLYQLYETQRALLSPFSEFASASAKLYSHPLSPFAHTPMASACRPALDLMHRLSKEYEKPEFDIGNIKVDGVDVAVQQQVAIDKPFCRLLRFKRFTDDRHTARDEGAAHACWWWRRCRATIRRCCATPCALLLQRPQGLHHRLDRRPHGAGRAGPFHLDDYVALRAGLHPPHRPRGQRDLGLPAHGAGAGRRFADGHAPARTRRAR